MLAPGLLLLAMLAGGGSAHADEKPSADASPTPLPALPEPTSLIGVVSTAIVIEAPTQAPTAPPLPPSTATAVPELPTATHTAVVEPSATQMVLPPSNKPLLGLGTPIVPVREFSPDATDTVVLAPTSTSTRIPSTSTATPTPTSTSSWLPPGPECAPKPGKIVVKLDVPYIHQVNDVDTGDGNWACGPTSVLMVLAYYGKLEPWPQYEIEQVSRITPTSIAMMKASKATSIRTAASKSANANEQEAKANYAPYLTNPYSYGGHTYSATALDPRGNRLAGLYGAICPTGLADWGMMAKVLEWHGLSTKRITATWDGVVAALKRGHPVLLGNDLTAAGHIMVAIGYTTNNNLIVNDPYGNRFAPGYGANSGQGVIYSWGCSRVRNALEVIGIYTPPATSTPVPTDAQVAEALPAKNTGQGAVLDERSISGIQGSNWLSFAAKAIGTSIPTEDVKTDSIPDVKASDRQAVAGKRPGTGNSQLLIADRTTTEPDAAYWWLAAPTFLALAAFVVMAIDGLPRAVRHKGDDPPAD